MSHLILLLFLAGHGLTRSSGILAARSIDDAIKQYNK